MFGTVLAKIARNEPLSQIELEQIERQGNDMESVASLARTLFAAGTSNLGIDFPIEKIYKDEVDVDTASFSLQIPSDFVHLMIWGQIRLNGSGGTSQQYVSMRFNDDSGANYVWDLISQVTTTPTANQGLGASQMIVDYAPADGAPAGHSSPFVVFIPNYKSPYYKSMLAIDGILVTNTSVALWQGVWKSTNTIEKISIFPETAAPVGTKIEAGSRISIYGIR